MTLEQPVTFDHAQASLQLEITRARTEFDTYLDSLEPAEREKFETESITLSKILIDPDIKNDERYEQWATAIDSVDESHRSAAVGYGILSSIEQNAPKIKDMDLTDGTKIRIVDAFSYSLAQAREFSKQQPRLPGRGTNILALTEFPAGDLVFDIRTLKEPIPEEMKQKFGLKVGSKVMFMHIPAKQPGEHLTKDGYVGALRNIAQEMKKHDDVEGCGSGSWLFDPELGEISPHLAWFQNYAFNKIALPEDPKQTELAAGSSKTRAKAIKDGTWKPRPHVIFLGRDEFLQRFG
jgi:hypothetical protein